MVIIGLGTPQVVVANGDRRAARCVGSNCILPAPFSPYRTKRTRALKHTIGIGHIGANHLPDVPQFCDEIAFEAEHVKNRIARLARGMDDV